MVGLCLVAVARVVGAADSGLPGLDKSRTCCSTQSNALLLKLARSRRLTVSVGSPGTQSAGDMALDSQQQRAMEAIQSGMNVFVTGAGGVGKSHLIRRVVTDLGLRKKVVVCAPTGVAAIQV